ncbi:MAG: ABC transporter permease subunit, partial [Nitrososphaerales archaeon]
VLGSGDFVKVLYGTTIVLILAIIIKEMPLGVQMIKAGVQQISNELEEASMAAGASWISTFRRIVIPLIKPTLIAVGIVVFIAAVRDIPTVVFLSTYHSRTISLLMLDYLAEASLESAAVVGVLIVFIICLLLFIGHFLGFRRVSGESLERVQPGLDKLVLTMITNTLLTRRNLTILLPSTIHETGKRNFKRIEEFWCHISISQ